MLLLFMVPKIVMTEIFLVAILQKLSRRDAPVLWLSSCSLFAVLTLHSPYIEERGMGEESCLVF
ncbi:hypothetical protein Nmel_003144, partial [Mimus melanotis]